MRSLYLAVAVLALGAYGTAQSADHIEVFGGYTYINPDFNLIAANGVSGWNASVNFKASRLFGAVLDVSGLYPRQTYPGQSGAAASTNSDQSYTFLFGPQVSLPLGRLSPFAHGLVGLTHVTPESFAGSSFNLFTSNNAFSVAAGGGLDYRLVRHIAIRGQVDWLYVRLTPAAGTDQGFNFSRDRNVARISTGVVFRF
jgi:opacity protein-like surface antigen